MPTEYSDKELLELASCPPNSTILNDPAPIDVAEERITIHRDALDGPVTFIVNLCCEEMVAIGAALTKIERHLKRLVNKELKGTGVALAQIANFLQVIALTNIGENNVLIQQLFQQQLFAPPLPTDRPPSELPESVQPFSQAPETAPAVEALFPGDTAFQPPSPPEEVIAPPALLPAITEPPEFPPETSAAVGGETIPLPVSLAPGVKPPGIELQPDFMNPEEVLA